MKNRLLSASDLEGFFPALATILDDSGEIDYVRQNMLIEDLVANKPAGIVVMGTTGQASTFDYGEHIAEVFRTAKIVNGRVPLIVGAGSNDTRKAVELSKSIEDMLGPTTFLHMTGYYLKASSESAVNHFLEVARNISGNIVLYNVPGRVTTRLNASAVTYLADRSPKKIVGIKQADATDDGIRDVQEIIFRTDKNRFSVLSGEDDKVFDLMGLGARGVISATGNICPKIFSEITGSFLAEQIDLSLEAQRRAMPYVEFCFMPPGNNPVNLSYLFDSGVRGCNYDLKTGFRTAREVAEKTKKDSDYQRVSSYERLIFSGDKLLASWNGLQTGIDLKKYQKVM